MDVKSQIGGVRRTGPVASVSPKIGRWPMCRHLCRSWNEQQELRFPGRPAGHSCTKAPFSPTAKSCGHHTGPIHGTAAPPNSLFITHMPAVSVASLPLPLFASLCLPLPPAASLCLRCFPCLASSCI